MTGNGKRIITAGQVDGRRRADGFPRRHPLYGTWYQMLKRCEDPKVRSYHRYGGRGVKVCERWHDPWLFVADIATLGDRPAGATLDRKDNDGDYELSNMQWALGKVQQQNRELSIRTAQRRAQVRVLWGQGQRASSVAKTLGIPRHVAKDDLAWLREHAARLALEAELRAARQRIAELEEMAKAR